MTASISLVPLRGYLARICFRRLSEEPKRGKAYNEQDEVVPVLGLGWDDDPLIWVVIWDGAPCPLHAVSLDGWGVEEFIILRETVIPCPPGWRINWNDMPTPQGTQGVAALVIRQAQGLSDEVFAVTAWGLELVCAEWTQGNCLEAPEDEAP